jgi:hypothetical protein
MRRAVGFSVMLLMAAGCASTGVGFWPVVSRTTRGVEAYPAGTVESVAHRARIALAERSLDIVRDAPTDDGTGRTIEATRSFLHVIIEIHPDTEATRTEVVASESSVEWDRGLARDILERIVKLPG